MSWRGDPATVEAQLAEVFERLRRLETGHAALPTRLAVDEPLYVPSLRPGSLVTGAANNDGQELRGAFSGDILAWDGTGLRWVVIPAGTVGQKLVRAAVLGGVHWVT